MQQAINHLASTLLPWQRDDTDIFKDKTLSVSEITAAVNALAIHGQDNGINIQVSVNLIRLNLRKFYSFYVIFTDDFFNSRNQILIIYKLFLSEVVIRDNLLLY